MFDNSIWSKLLIQHPIITFCMLRSLQYQLLWNKCFSLIHFVSLTPNAVNSSIMRTNIRTMPRLPTMDKQQLVTHLWHSVSCWHNDDIEHCFGWKDFHYMAYEYLPQSSTYITNDARPKIIEATLTLIFSMGQGACRFCFGCVRQPIPYLWMSGTNCHVDNPWCESKSCRHSVNAHF